MARQNSKMVAEGLMIWKEIAYAVIVKDQLFARVWMN